MTFGCIRFINNFTIISSSLVSLVKTLVDNSQKRPKKLKRENVSDDIILNIANEIKTLNNDDRTLEDTKKNFPEK